MGIDVAALRAWVELTCAAQGIPVAVTDSATVFRVGVLLSGAGCCGKSRSDGRSARALTAAEWERSG
jgi:hypothetical protein